MFNDVAYELRAYGPPALLVALLSVAPLLVLVPLVLLRFRVASGWFLALPWPAALVGAYGVYATNLQGTFKAFVLPLPDVARVAVDTSYQANAVAMFAAWCAVVVAWITLASVSLAGSLSTLGRPAVVGWVRAAGLAGGLLALSVGAFVTLQLGRFTPGLRLWPWFKLALDDVAGLLKGDRMTWMIFLPSVSLVLAAPFLALLWLRTPDLPERIHGLRRAAAGSLGAALLLGGACGLFHLRMSWHGVGLRVGPEAYVGLREDLGAHLTAAFVTGALLLVVFALAWAWIVRSEPVRAPAWRWLGVGSAGAVGLAWVAYTLPASDWFLDQIQWVKPETRAFEARSGPLPEIEPAPGRPTAAHTLALLQDQSGTWEVEYAPVHVEVDDRWPPPGVLWPGFSILAPADAPAVHLLEGAPDEVVEVSIWAKVDGSTKAVPVRVEVQPPTPEIWEAVRLGREGYAFWFNDGNQIVWRDTYLLLEPTASRSDLVWILDDRVPLGAWLRECSSAADVCRAVRGGVRAAYEAGAPNYPWPEPP